MQSKDSKKYYSNQKNHGFTMVEVLISIIIFAIGILGASALQLASFNANTSSMYRTQAIFLANDIADRMRRDRQTARAGAFNNINSSATPPTSNGCNGDTGCNGEELAVQSIVEWVNYFRDENNPLLPNSTGTVVRLGGNTFRISITWNENDKLTRTSTQNSYSIDIQI